MIIFSCLITSDITATLVATARCHGMPRFPNQSVWLSRNFLGRYFIAQSCTMNTDVSSSSSSTCTLASSWFTERRRWAFHAIIAVLAFFTRNSSSSPNVVAKLWYFAVNPASMLVRVDPNTAHRSQTSLCWWSQVAWNKGSVGSLKANDLQWSATDAVLETWTCKWKKKCVVFVYV